MKLLVLLCCVAVAVHGAPTSGHSHAIRKLMETQSQLKVFRTLAGQQGDAPSGGDIKPGCCVAALVCFRHNLLNATEHRDAGRKLFSSLRNTKLVEAVRCSDPGPTSAPPLCPACASFPRTEAELLDQLTQFLQRALSSWAAKGLSGRS